VAVGKLRVVVVGVKVFAVTMVGTAVEIGVLALITVALGTGVSVTVADGVF
jgi:putative Mn2+ efflux pump MntP